MPNNILWRTVGRLAGSGNFMTDKLKEIEKPCPATLKGCEWKLVEHFDDFGALEFYEAFCQKCYRNRDWSKLEYKFDSLNL